jgi:hypothetical protein
MLRSASALRAAVWCPRWSLTIEFLLKILTTVRQLSSCQAVTQQARDEPDAECQVAKDTIAHPVMAPSPIAFVAVAGLGAALMALLPGIKRVVRRSSLKEIVIKGALHSSPQPIRTC